MGGTRKTQVGGEKEKVKGIELLLGRRKTTSKFTRTEHWKINTLEALLLSLETFRSQHSGESIYRRGWEGEKKDAL